jgi:hypothetical protein
VASKQVAAQLRVQVQPEAWPQALQKQNMKENSVMQSVTCAMRQQSRLLPSIQMQPDPGRRLCNTETTY